MTDYKVPGRSRQNGDVTVTSSLKCYVKQSVFASMEAEVTELELGGLVGI